MSEAARVLCVDDEQNVLDALERNLGEFYEVITANGGEAGIAALGEQGPFDVVISDMRMPGMSGEETARRMRAQGLETPIVALTANAFEDDRRACLAAGMNDFLVKPLTPDALRAVLSRWAGEPWTRAAARAKVG